MTVIATVADPDGNTVVLTARAWAHIIRTDGHPELMPHQRAVVDAVSHSDRRNDDPIKGRKRFWKHGIGPSRWLWVVVDYGSEPAEIVTAFPYRHDPEDWQQP